MDAKLKERAEGVAQLRNHNSRFTTEQFREIGEVHHLLTGRNINCISCNVYGLLNEINAKLIQEPLIIKDMANAKIHFKSNAASKLVIRHGKNGTVAITPENLNEGDNAEFMAKHYSHLVEETKSKAAEETAPAKTAAPAKTETTTKTTSSPAKK